MQTNPASVPRSVFLLHAARQPMGEARRRAEAMAQVLGAQLVVVKLSQPLRGRSHTFFPQAHLADGIAALTQGLRETRALDRWADARERHGLPALEVVRSSPSLEALAEICKRPGLALVVIPASFAWFASRLTALTARLSVPVLIARKPGAEDRLVVATNLEDPTRPVVFQAFTLAERLDVPLTIVHNVAGFGAKLVAAGMAGAMPLLPVDDDLLADEQQRALAVEFGALHRPANITVTRRLDAASGILEAAIRARADLIVLGVRARSTPGMFADHVAERVCGAAQRSVLLVPV